MDLVCLPTFDKLRLISDSSARKMIAVAAWWSVLIAGALADESPLSQEHFTHP